MSLGLQNEKKKYKMDLFFVSVEAKKICTCPKNSNQKDQFNKIFCFEKFSETALSS
jgi:hypothetical protein